MRHAWLCLLGLFLPNTLLYGHDDEGDIYGHDDEAQSEGKEGSTEDSVETRPTGGDAILESPEFSLFKEDFVVLCCKHRTPRNETKATFFKDGSPLNMDASSLGAAKTIYSVSVSDSGTYKCKFDGGAESEAKQLRVQTRRRTVQLMAERTIISAQDHVKLTCSVEDSTGFQYDFIRSTSASSEKRKIQTESINKFVISHGGYYTCRGWRREPDVLTPESPALTIHETVLKRVRVTLEPRWTRIFPGEEITLKCVIQDVGDTGWTYEWKTPDSDSLQPHNEYIRSSNHSGQYCCRGTRDYFLTQWSDTKNLTVSEYRPKAVLHADYRDIPVGDSVTLTCFVGSSSGWRYFWYTDKETSELLNTQDRRIRVSQAGLYWCRGGRGDPVYYTEYSDPIRINKNIENEAVVTLHPNWSEICKGEMITLRCEIKNGGDTKWEHEWTTPSSDKSLKQNEYSIRSAEAFHSGTYKCKGRLKGPQQSSTDWSDPIKLKVSAKPQPVLTVSPSWLSPGDSVALNCSVKHPSAGWSFYWFKAVPKLPDSYSYELLPNSTNGTDQGSYMVHGQTHSAGYVCRAGRGDPVFHTHFSKPKFVWSGDLPSPASLTVSPDRVQHFTKEPVSLSCEGNSTEWRVSRFSPSGYQLHCNYWGTMTGSTCTMDRYWITGVYWCESGSGEFSNAVNITKWDKDVILTSPVHPVTEGQSVSLSCKLRGHDVKTSKVFFFRNGELIQNDTRRELNISAVSKSDEGLYKCENSGEESPLSWMSVKAGSRSDGSSFPVLLIIGLDCGIILILLLLLFYCCRSSKDSCLFSRLIPSGSTATSHTVNQNEAQSNKYSSPLDGSEDTGNDADDSHDVTYSLIELKNIEKKEISTASATDEPVYSEVRPGTAVGDNAAI